MKKTLSLLLLLSLVLSLASCGQKTTTDDPVAAATLAESYQSYLDTAEPSYAYDIALELTTNPEYFNAEQGGRNAGSDAEHAAADYLVGVMKDIGLADVEKQAAQCDRWQFNSASLTIDGKDYNVYTYATASTPAEGLTAEVVYVNKGTRQDYEGLDVTGKIVLLDIDQRNDWWITYPMLEAMHQGAVGVLAANVGGFAQIADDALNSQDICGPVGIPTLSIGVADSKEIQEKLKAGSVSATMKVDNEVEIDAGTTYNITGVLKGKSSDHQILVGGHYDVHFQGFQDDNCAVGLVLAMANAMVKSGYQPENDIVFCLHGAEEWGSSYTQYDWTVGAWEMINHVHPEWVGKTLAFINFELPAMNEGTSDQIRTSYELKTFVDGFKSAVPQVDGVFPDGIEIIVPTQTWSDDFSLSIAGVPSSVTALRGGFAQTHYHSQFDDRDTYSREAFLFHHNMYGLLMMAYDHCAVSPLDFSTRLSALRDAMDDTVMTAQQTAALNAALDEAESAASAAWEKVSEVNAAYQKALDAGDTAQADALLQESRQLNADVLAAFKFAEDSFVRLTWEDSSFFPHEHSQNNLTALKSAAEALKQGDSAAALDDYLYLVDNNWYAYDWSRETFTYFTDYVLNQSADRLMWGAGRVQGHEDLFDVIRSLQEKRGDGGADYTAELARLDQAIAAQTAMLNEQVSHEVSALEELTARLTQIAA